MRTYDVTPVSIYVRKRLRQVAEILLIVSAVSVIIGMIYTIVDVSRVNKELLQLQKENKLLKSDMREGKIDISRVKTELLQLQGENRLLESKMTKCCRRRKDREGKIELNSRVEAKLLKLQEQYKMLKSEMKTTMLCRRKDRQGTIDKDDITGRKHRGQSCRKSQLGLPAMHLTGPVTEQMWKSANQLLSRTNVDGGVVTADGLMPTGILYRFWKEGTEESLYPGQPSFAEYRSSGAIHIKEDGLYYVYAQIMFHDTYQTFAYGIMVDAAGSEQGEGTKEALRCLVTTNNTEHVQSRRMSNVIYQPCATFGVLRLKEGDSLTVENLYKHRVNMLLHGLDTLTYWGLIKIQ